MDREAGKIAKVDGNCGAPGKPSKGVWAYFKSHEKLVKDWQQWRDKIHL